MGSCTWENCTNIVAPLPGDPPKCHRVARAYSGDAMKEIPLTKGYVAIVDEIDYYRLIERTWSFNYYAYRHIRVRDKPGGKRKSIFIAMHREIIGAVPGQEVDHINGNKLDNRRCNLRICSRTENLYNRNQIGYGKHGHVGVDYRKDMSKWRARVVRSLVGYYKTKEDAINAREEAAKKLFGEFYRREQC